jgi:hypothetical protein
MTPAKQGNRAGYCYGCNELDTEVRRASGTRPPYTRCATLAHCAGRGIVIIHERHVCCDNVLMRPSTYQSYAHPRQPKKPTALACVCYHMLTAPRGHSQSVPVSTEPPLRMPHPDVSKLRHSIVSASERGNAKNLLSHPHTDIGVAKTRTCGI